MVHLFNDLNTTGGKGLPEDDVPLREEVVPIFNLGISVGAELGVEKARLQPSGEALPVLKESGRVKVVVPKLDIHQLIELDLRRK